jgi:hypothetical protein
LERTNEGSLAISVIWQAEELAMELAIVFAIAWFDLFYLFLWSLFLYDDVLDWFNTNTSGYEQFHSREDSD